MASKQAACLACRKSKIKCKREPDSTICEKCELANTECVIPSFHVGRQKGVKNKRTGLDKAIYQIEEAIRKSKADTLADEGTLGQLQNLLEEARQNQRESVDTSPATNTTNPAFGAERDVTAPASDEALALDDAENPLQLLARASDLRLTTSPSFGFNESTPSSSRNFGSEYENCSDIQRFFLPMKVSLDVGLDLDPIDIGLVTMEESEVLLSFFHEKLAHTRWGLDPSLHTLKFVRSRSAFLFTSILAAAASFIPSTAAIAKRLHLHRKTLAQQLLSRRLRSVEIVLALMINIPWMHPGAHSADDDTGLYISMAISIALDLSLNKIITPSSGFDTEILKRVPKGDCIEARKVLAMDGFEDVDPSSGIGRRLLRRRERVWIALFVLERGVCLARGRNYCVPITPLIKFCDRWHTNDTAIPQDGPLVSMAVLRRDLDDLFSTVRARCDSYRVIDVGSKVAHEIETTIDNFFSKWLATWTVAIGEGDQKALPPYVEILVTHTRLSTYSGVMNHPTAPAEVKRVFRASALSSALNVMRAAIQGEGRLQSMPNNTAIMICFAACVALNLSTPAPGGNVSLAPSVRNLIEETASVLERIGSTPSHRNGISVLYGKYLREIVKQAPQLPKPVDPALLNPTAQPAQAQDAVFDPVADAVQPALDQSQYTMPASTVWGEPLQFSHMSGNEIIETVMNAGEFDASIFDFPMEDASGYAWMDWMNPPEFGFR